MKRTLPAALATVALLAGCALPQQPPPASSLQTPAGWRGAASGSDTTTAAAVQPGWWQGFGDPTLDALVQSALAANTDLRVARSRIAEYQARLTVAEAAQWPALSASFSPA
ncbi:MAG: transporter, partial [Aquincola sp.]|nr:transporter [Aquincola sp.]